MMKNPTNNRVVCEGRRVRWSTDTLEWFLCGKRLQYEHKIGIAYDAKVRFDHYRDEAPDNQWRPHFMVLLARPSSREAAGYFEALLIAHVTSHDIEGDSTKARVVPRSARLRTVACYGRG